MIDKHSILLPTDELTDWQRRPLGPVSGITYRAAEWQIYDGNSWEGRKPERKRKSNTLEYTTQDKAGGAAVDVAINKTKWKCK